MNHKREKAIIGKCITFGEFVQKDGYESGTHFYYLNDIYYTESKYRNYELRLTDAGTAENDITMIWYGIRIRDGHKCDIPYDADIYKVHQWAVKKVYKELVDALKREIMAGRSNSMLSHLRK